MQNRKLFKQSILDDLVYDEEYQEKQKCSEAGTGGLENDSEAISNQYYLKSKY